MYSLCRSLGEGYGMLSEEIDSEEFYDANEQTPLRSPKFVRFFTFAPSMDECGMCVRSPDVL